MGRVGDTHDVRVRTFLQAMRIKTEGHSYRRDKATTVKTCQTVSQERSQLFKHMQGLSPVHPHEPLKNVPLPCCRIKPVMHGMKDVALIRKPTS